MNVLDSLNSWLLNNPDYQGDEVHDEAIEGGDKRDLKTSADNCRTDVSEHLNGVNTWARPNNVPKMAKTSAPLPIS